MQEQALQVGSARVLETSPSATVGKPGRPRGCGAGHQQYLLKRKLFIHYAN